MKRLVLFLLMILFLSDCSDFYHLQYKKLGKIAVHGFVAPLQPHERQISGDRKSSGKDSAFVERDSLVPEKRRPEISAVEKRIQQVLPVRKRIEKKSKEIHPGKYVPAHPLKIRREKSVFSALKIMLDFFIDLCIMSIGLWIFIMAFYTGLALLAIAGFIIFFMGAVSYYELIVMLVITLIRKLRKLPDSKSKFEEK